MGGPQYHEETKAIKDVRSRLRCDFLLQRKQNLIKCYQSPIKHVQEPPLILAMSNNT